MAKLKEFRKGSILRGGQHEKIVCAYKKKDAIELLGITEYEYQNYTVKLESPITKKAENNPLTVFIEIDRCGGELTKYDKRLSGKIVEETVFERFLRMYKKHYPTERDMLKAFGYC